jgi:hypothetical protein
MLKVIGVSTNGNIDHGTQNLEGYNRIVIESSCIGLEDIGFSSMDGFCEDSTFVSSNGEFFCVEGKIIFRELLAIEEQLVSLNLKSYIPNTHGSTFNLAPPVMNGSTDMDIKNLVTIDMVSVNKDQVAFSMELKGLAVPTLEVRVSSNSTGLGSRRRRTATAFASVPVATGIVADEWTRMFPSCG